MHQAEGPAFAKTQRWGEELHRERRKPGKVWEMNMERYAGTESWRTLNAYRAWEPLMAHEGENGKINTDWKGARVQCGGSFRSGTKSHLSRLSPKLARTKKRGD